jgi:hypothetical protein
MTKKEIKFIKGYLYCNIAKHYNVSIEQIDLEFKEYFGFEKLSEQDNDMFNEICIECFKISDKFGLNLNFPNNEWNKVYDINKDEA